MADKRLFKYKLWCAIEAVYLYTWAEALPEACPHNSAHALDHSKDEIVDTMVAGESEVIIRQESPDATTGGHFQTQTWEITVPAGADPDPVNIVFPFGISILVAKMVAPEAAVGDELFVTVAPDTIIGVLPLPHAAGVAEFKIYPASSLEKMAIGYWISVNGEDLGRILEINKTAGTFKTEATLAADAGAGALLRMTIKMIPRKKILSTEPWEIGESTIGSSYLPPGRPITIKYKNNTLTAKTMPFDMEYLY